MKNGSKRNSKVVQCWFHLRKILPRVDGQRHYGLTESYSLSIIDMLINETSSWKKLSFIDTHLSYNNIITNLKDSSRITSRMMVWTILIFVLLFLRVWAILYII